MLTGAVRQNCKKVSVLVPPASGTGTAVSGTGSTGSSGTAKTVYGRIPAGQDVPAGDYADSVTITISF